MDDTSIWHMVIRLAKMGSADLGRKSLAEADFKPHNHPNQKITIKQWSPKKGNGEKWMKLGEYGKHLHDTKGRLTPENSRDS